MIKCFLFFTKCRCFPILSAFVLHTVYCYVFKEKRRMNKMYGRPIGGFGHGGFHGGFGHSPFFGGGFFPGFVAGALLSPGFGYGGYGYPYYPDYSYYTGYQQDPYYSYNTY
ncbi:hypothetical protein CN340_28245 [Bacillus anthracis]|nr:hypothetical protein CN340_28245 [Bacillus anthracis]